MTKIKPMSMDRMRHIVGIVTVERQHAMKRAEEKPIYSCREDFMTLISAWADAEARARMNIDPYAESIEPYLAEVLSEIGWPDE